MCDVCVCFAAPDAAHVNRGPTPVTVLNHGRRISTGDYLVVTAVAQPQGGVSFDIGISGNKPDGADMTWDADPPPFPGCVTQNVFLCQYFSCLFPI